MPAGVLSHSVALTGDIAKDSVRQIRWQGFARKNRRQKMLAGFVEAIEAFLGPIINQASDPQQTYESHCTALPESPRAAPP